MTTVLPDTVDVIDAREISDGDDVWWRVAWATLATPGDRLVWQAIQAFGAQGALEQMWAGRGRAGLRHLARACDAAPEEIVAFGKRYPHPPSTDQLDAVKARVRLLGLSLLSPDSDDWPSPLCDLGPYQPIVMFVQGSASILEGASTLGVVGSRSPTDDARHACIDITREAISSGYTLVSGGARGIDWVAHTTAASMGAPQVMVLATASDRLGSWQPDMVRHISRHGLVLTETPPGHSITPQSFLHRNRIIAALSERVIVVEAANRSGSLNTASHAKGLGRDLSAVVSRPSDDRNAGCYRLVDEWGADRYRRGSVARE